MKSFEVITFMLVFTLITLVGCEKDENEKQDNLQQTGIIGKWKLESRSIDGISSLAVECCDYIEFKTDNELDDFKGEFMAYGTGYETTGEFELNTTENTIHFDYNNTCRSYEYQIFAGLLEFIYMEDDQKIGEDWRKEE